MAVTRRRARASCITSSDPSCCGHLHLDRSECHSLWHKFRPGHGHVPIGPVKGQHPLQVALGKPFLFRQFVHADLVARDKASLDIFWLKDDSLDNLDDLPPPEVLQQEIIEHLEAALASFRDVAAGLTLPPGKG